MPALQVRDLPQELYDQLVGEAAVEYRSLAQQTTAILDRHFKVLEGGISNVPGLAEDYEESERVRFPISRRERREAVLQRLDQLPPVEVPDRFPSVSELLEEDRRERDDRFGL